MADMNEADIIEMFREVSTVLVGEEEEHKSLISAGDEFFSVKKKLASLEEEACERVRGIQSEIAMKERELGEVLSKLEDEKQCFAKLKSDNDKLQADVDAVNKEQQSLLQLLEEDERKSRTTLPHLRKEISLCEGVTNIKWDYTTPAERIAGFVANKRNVRPFDFDTREHSKYFIANAIWDMIEPSWECAKPEVQDTSEVNDKDKPDATEKENMETEPV